MAITGYVITPVNVDTSAQLPAINVPGDATYFDIGSLTTGVTYKFLIYAKNSAGNGAVATSPIILLGGPGPPPPPPPPPPGGATIPGTPTNVTGVVGDGTISLGWKTPSEDGGSPITGYKISYTPVEGAEKFRDVGVVTNTVLPGLDNNTTYIIKIAAKNIVGIGPSSETQSFTMSSQELIYDLSSWSSFNNIIQTYTINYTEVKTQFNALTSISRNTTPDSLYISPDELYPAHDEVGKVTFRTVKRKKDAYIVNGATNYYEPLSETTVSAELQNTAANLVTAGLGPSIIPMPDAGFIQNMLKFSARPGDILTLYKKFKSYFSTNSLFLTEHGEGAATEWKTNRETIGCTDPNVCLMPGWAYEYTHTRPFLRFNTRNLVADNVIIRTFLTFKKDPNCPITDPEKLSLKFVKVNDSINDNNLISIDFNNIEGTVLATLPLSDEVLQSGQTVYLPINDLSFIKPYDITKIAIITELENTTLPSSWTQITLQDIKLHISIDTSTIKTPGKVSYITAIPTNGGVSIEWGSPVIDGGSAILSYSITNTNTGQTTQVLAEVLKSVYTYNLTGLTNGILYSFIITANNVRGEGQGESFVVTPTVSATLPGAVRSFYAFPEDAKAILYWYPPLEIGTTPIEAYFITNQTTGEAINASAKNTSYEITNLVNNTTYTIAIVAKNGTGAGPVSTTTVTPTSGLTVPSRPTIVDLYAVEGKVTLFWDFPVSDGADPLIGWNITLDAPGIPNFNPVIFVLSDPTQLKFTRSGLSKGNTYVISVAAINSTGTGPFAVSDPFTVSSEITTKGIFVPVKYNYKKFYDAPIDLNIYSPNYLKKLYPENDEFYAEYGPAYIQNDPKVTYPISLGSSFNTLYLTLSTSYGSVNYSIYLLHSRFITPNAWTSENIANRINDMCEILKIPILALSIGQKLLIKTIPIGKDVKLSLTPNKQKSANQIIFGTDPIIKNGFTEYPVTNNIPTSEYDAIHKKALVESKVWTIVRNSDISRPSFYVSHNDEKLGNCYDINLVSDLKPNSVNIQYFDKNNKPVILRDYLGDGRLLYRLKQSAGAGEAITFTYPADALKPNIDPSDGVSSFGDIDYKTGKITNLIFPTFFTSNGVLYPTFKPAIILGKNVTWPIYLKNDSVLYLNVNNVVQGFFIPKNEFTDITDNPLPSEDTVYSVQDIANILNNNSSFKKELGLVAGVMGGQLYIQNIGSDSETNLPINIGPDFTLTLVEDDGNHLVMSGNNIGEINSCNRLLFGMTPIQQPPTRIYITYAYTNNDSNPYNHVWYSTPHFILKSLGKDNQFITKGHLDYLLNKLNLFRPSTSVLENIAFNSSFEETTNIFDEIVSYTIPNVSLPYIQVIHTPQVQTYFQNESVDVKVINPDDQEDIKADLFTYK